MDATRNKPDHTIFEKADFYLDSRYQVKQILGKGSYGTVCSAVDLNSKGQAQLAIKKVSNIFNKELLMKRAVRELKLMRYFKGHKNIVGLVDLDIVLLKPYDGLYCFQELIDYDLARVIHSSVQFSEYHISSFLYQILCGVKYIHSAEVIHRDLKPGNILVTIHGTLKICDFGLARGISKEYLNLGLRSQAITNYVATRWYRAPELMLSRKSYGKEGEYIVLFQCAITLWLTNKILKVDMWAVGCIFGELYGRRPLFVGSDQIHQIEEILKVLGTPGKEAIVRYGTHMAWSFFSPPKPQYKCLSWEQVYPYASPDAHDLLGKLLTWNCEERYDVDQCLEHRYLTNIRNPDDEPVCSKPFDFSFEWTATTLGQLKELLQEEVAEFKKTRMMKQKPKYF
ncbi:unnamed protein product [Kuraishia capsulata CBS 1993]|uniref:Protein kinase domain-containing protein n=1 Tax=Kuraishia capsulata CBS 1993 TaxID=1382522 RepID=W6MSN3_9ASCO|nr:uncharacterized protein KUCA_T00005376001 [Kuraishia capsulata CBS 1993]CDK29388.1 unnamed protein product [Kuraishia capsulata CBS 1993]